MARHTVHAAEREAQSAAEAADKARADLENMTRLEKEKTEREKQKAQRLLMRSLRAGGGGYFETDTSTSGKGTLLGGTGAVG